MAQLFARMNLILPITSLLPYRLHAIWLNMVPIERQMRQSVKLFTDKFLVVKNLEKVFYMICGVALVFVGIIIGGLLENNADAQTESEVPEYKVVEVTVHKKSDTYIQDQINEVCSSGLYDFHQMITTYTISDGIPYKAMLIFKKK